MKKLFKGALIALGIIFLILCLLPAESQAYQTISGLGSFSLLVVIFSGIYVGVQRMQRKTGPQTF
jgi:uncharacterized membrane protein